jgi:hypothetical protein
MYSCSFVVDTFWKRRGKEGEKRLGKGRENCGMEEKDGEGKKK